MTHTPLHWTSKIPQRYKRSAINGDVNRSYQTSMNFDHEKETTREKYHLAGFPTRFVDSAIHQFHQKLIDEQVEYELIIPDFLFAEPKKNSFCEYELIIPDFLFAEPKKIHFVKVFMFYIILSNVETVCYTKK